MKKRIGRSAAIVLSAILIAWQGMTALAWEQSAFMEEPAVAPETLPEDSETPAEAVAEPADGEEAPGVRSYLRRHGGADDEEILRALVALLNGEEIDDPMLSGYSLSFDTESLQTELDEAEGVQTLELGAYMEENAEDGVLLVDAETLAEERDVTAQQTAGDTRAEEEDEEPVTAVFSDFMDGLVFSGVDTVAAEIAEPDILEQLPGTIGALFEDADAVPRAGETAEATLYGVPVTVGAQADAAGEIARYVGFTDGGLLLFTADAAGEISYIEAFDVAVEESGVAFSDAAHGVFFTGLSDLLEALDVPLEEVRADDEGRMVIGAGEGREISVFVDEDDVIFYDFSKELRFADGCFYPAKAPVEESGDAEEAPAETEEHPLAALLKEFFVLRAHAAEETAEDGSPAETEAPAEREASEEDAAENDGSDEEEEAPADETDTEDEEEPADETDTEDEEAPADETEDVPLRASDLAGAPLPAFGQMFRFAADGGRFVLSAQGDGWVCSQLTEEDTVETVLWVQEDGTLRYFADEDISESGSGSAEVPGEDASSEDDAEEEPEEDDAAEDPAEEPAVPEQPGEGEPAEEPEAPEQPGEGNPAEEPEAPEQPGEGNPAEEPEAPEQPGEGNPAEEPGAPEQPEEENPADEGAAQP